MMTDQRRRRRRGLGTLILITGFVCVALATTACESKDAPAPSAVAVKFVTAESLVAEITRLCVEQPRIDLTAMTELTFTENDLQEQMLEQLLGMAALDAYDAARWDAFPEDRDEAYPPMEPDEHKPVLLPADIDGRRVASQLQNDGSTLNFHLIETESGWWISGYTYERNEGWSKLLIEDNEDEELVRYYRVLPSVLPDVTRRIKAGEFRNRAAAERAFQEGMAGRY